MPGNGQTPENTYNNSTIEAKPQRLPFPEFWDIEGEQLELDFPENCIEDPLPAARPEGANGNHRNMVDENDPLPAAQSHQPGIRVRTPEEIEEDNEDRNSVYGR